MLERGHQARRKPSALLRRIEQHRAGEHPSPDALLPRPQDQADVPRGEGAYLRPEVAADKSVEVDREDRHAIPLEDMMRDGEAGCREEERACRAVRASTGRLVGDGHPLPQLTLQLRRIGDTSGRRLVDVNMGPHTWACAVCA